MLAYRHAFHAGNHGDVLKHLVLTLVLQHMAHKEKGYRYVETHAGAGAYTLTSGLAAKKGEYRQGVGALWNRADLPAPVAAYLAQVRAFNGDGAACRRYPGSPAIARQLRRPQDQLVLYELHPADFRLLAQRFAHDKGVRVEHADGFEALRSQLPPPTRRAVVLIDPSYELERDYGRTVACLRDALTRFAEGTYIVWYPHVSRLPAQQMPKKLQVLAPKGWLHARLTVQQTDALGFGLAGSGVFVINPPHTLHAQLAGVLPWLHDALKQFDGGGVLLDQRAA
jgi:23S rRNA (adenine2030-N6)-methyltransferase